MAPRSSPAAKSPARRREHPLDKTLREAPVGPPESARERRLVAVAKREIAAGKSLTLDEIKKRLGQTPNVAAGSAPAKSARPGRRDDPVARALRNAPLDDEPETPKERRLVATAKRQAARGEVYTHEQVRKLLGL